MSELFAFVAIELAWFNRVGREIPLDEVATTEFAVLNPLCPALPGDYLITVGCFNSEVPTGLLVLVVYGTLTVWLDDFLTSDVLYVGTWGFVFSPYTGVLDFC